MGHIPAAAALEPLFAATLGADLPLSIRFWDGSRLGPEVAKATVVLRSPRALRRVVWAPSELGFGRAYVAGELDVEGDVLHALAVLRTNAPDLEVGARTWARTLAAAARLGVLGPPPPRPVEEARLRGLAHSARRDAAAVVHHYDVGNDFYRLVLGETMTYSCARFISPDDTLDDAQRAKYDLVAGKLGLGPGLRLLDVGCGWGGMVMRAAEHFGARAVGVTLSPQQHGLARQRVEAAGLAGQVDVRLQDYRDLGAQEEASFDAVSSIGMSEHVGRSRLHEYFEVLAARLRPGGRLLNHAISTPEGARYDRRSFLNRYVFPDGELQDLAAVVAAMQGAGLEVRDVESLREHYALTLRHWVANLERHWDQAVALVGLARARVWHLYTMASVVSFEAGEISVHQVLAVKPGPGGASGMPLTRSGFG